MLVIQLKIGSQQWKISNDKNYMGKELSTFSKSVKYINNYWSEETKENSFVISKLSTFIQYQFLLN